MGLSNVSGTCRLAALAKASLKRETLSASGCCFTASCDSVPLSTRQPAENGSPHAARHAQGPRGVRSHDARAGRCGDAHIHTFVHTCRRRPLSARRAVEPARANARPLERRWVTAIACPLNPNSNDLLSSSRDKSVILWTLTRDGGDFGDSYGTPKRSLRGHSHFVQDVVISSDGQVSTGRLPLAAPWGGGGKESSAATHRSRHVARAVAVPLSARALRTAPSPRRGAAAGAPEAQQNPMGAPSAPGFAAPTHAAWRAPLPRCSCGGRGSACLSRH